MAKKQTITYSGRLIYNIYAEYQLLSPTVAIDLSELLSKVYYAEDSNYIELKIMNAKKIVFNEQGTLLLKKDNDGIYGYHINGENLELALFDSVDKDLFVEIYADALQELGDTYGTETK